MKTFVTGAALALVSMAAGAATVGTGAAVEPPANPFPGGCEQQSSTAADEQSGERAIHFHAESQSRGDGQCDATSTHSPNQEFNNDAVRGLGNEASSADFDPGQDLDHPGDGR